MQKTYRFIALVVLTVGMLAARPALADTITYTGNDFNVVNSPFTSSEAITGSVTITGSLGDNLNDVNIAPMVTGFSFNDGVNTLSNTTGDLLNYFYVWTNASGQIAEWSLYTYNISNSISVFYEPGGISRPNAVDKAFSGSHEAEAVDEPGTFTEGTALAATPEPSSFALFGTGALGAIAAIRRRRSLVSR